MTADTTAPSIALSAIDQARFGCRTAKASAVTRDGVPGMLAFCHEQRVDLLIARCSADDLPAAQAMEQAGCRLMDTLVYYARDLMRLPDPADARGLAVRALAPGDEDAVVGVAREAFRGYRVGHYHADPRLDPSACDAVYPSWARALCDAHGATSAVLVAGAAGAVTGFLCLRLNDPTEGEGVLNGVLPAAQGQGVYTALLTAGLDWCRVRGAQRFVISTQLTNWRVQAVWARLGLALSDAQYTFHKWFD